MPDPCPCSYHARERELEDRIRALADRNDALTSSLSAAEKELVLNRTSVAMMTDPIADAIEQALARVTKPSRIEAAERAVVEAADAWWDATEVEHAPCRGNLFDAVVALRALREQAAAETCGAMTGGMWITAADGHAIGTPKSVTRCDLPRGHEGEHEGELGTWKWSG